MSSQESVFVLSPVPNTFNHQRDWEQGLSFIEYKMANLKLSIIELLDIHIKNLNSATQSAAKLHLSRLKITYSCYELFHRKEEQGYGKPSLLRKERQ